MTGPRGQPRLGSSQAQQEERTTKAISITAYGEPGVLEQRELPEPAPGPGAVSITVSHAAVGLVDAIIRRGELAEYDYAPKPPLVPGLEVAGSVRAVGPSVDRFAVGDEVATLTLPGMGAREVAGRLVLTVP